MAYKLNADTWTLLTETSGTADNKSKSNDIILANTATEPTSEVDTMLLRAGERRYIEATENLIYAKTLGGEATLAITGFSQSNAVLKEQIQNCLSLGYTYGGILAEQTEVVEGHVYLAYTDDTKGTTVISNVSKSWILGEDNIDSDFEEFTGESLNLKIENIYNKENIITLSANSVEYDITNFFKNLDGEIKNISCLISLTVKNTTYSQGGSLYYIFRNNSEVFDIFAIREGGSAGAPRIKKDDADSKIIKAYQSSGSQLECEIKVI